MQMKNKEVNKLEGHGTVVKNLEKSMDRGVWLGPLQSMGLQRV